MGLECEELGRVAEVEVEVDAVLEVLFLFLSFFLAFFLLVVIASCVGAGAGVELVGRLLVSCRSAAG